MQKNDSTNTTESTNTINLSYIKKMEFRFNHRNKQLYPLLVGIIRQFAPKNT